MQGTATFQLSVTLKGPVGDPDEENADEELRELLAEMLESYPEVVRYRIEGATIEEVH